MSAGERHVDYWRAVIRRALMDCSTVDYHDLTEAAVDNMALVAAQAVCTDLFTTPYPPLPQSG